MLLSTDINGQKIYPGSEVILPGTRWRGVVEDAYERQSGPNKGKIFVMWIGRPYLATEIPAELQVVTGDSLDEARVALDAVELAGTSVGEFHAMRSALDALKKVLDEYRINP